MNIKQEHVKFAKLLNQILIAEKRYTVESIARRTSTPETEIRQYCEGTLAVPVEFQALIYNATGDIDFLNFTIDDTDKQLIDRHIDGGKVDKSLLRETSDVADAVGHLLQSVEKQEKIISMSGIKTSHTESLVIIKHLNMIIKVSEDMRACIEKMSEKVNIITINDNK